MHFVEDSQMAYEIENMGDKMLHLSQENIQAILERDCTKSLKSYDDAFLVRIFCMQTMWVGKHHSYGKLVEFYHID